MAVILRNTITTGSNHFNSSEEFAAFLGNFPIGVSHRNEIQACIANNTLISNSITKSDDTTFVVTKTFADQARYEIYKGATDPFAEDTLALYLSIGWTSTPDITTT